MLAAALANADAVLEAVAKAGVTLCYAEDFVYAPPVAKLRRLLGASGGAILELRAEESHSGSHAAYARRWKSAGGGALLRMGSHPIGAVLHLKHWEGLQRRGRPVRVRAAFAEVANLTRLRQRPVRIPVSESAGSPELSDDGRYLAAWDEGIFVWDARTGRKVAGPIHADSEGWQFAPRDRLITQSEAGGAVRVWDARTGRPLPPAMPTPQSVLASVSFAADGRTLAATVDRLFIV